MKLKGVRLGFALTGSHCTLENIFPELDKLISEGAEICPIISPSIDHTDTRFGETTEWKSRLVQTTGHRLINSIVGAEPIGPQALLDVYIIAPCTGNTLAKLANGITDTPVLMGAKAQLRNLRPVVLSITTNDGLGINLKNIGLLLNTKNIYLVPFGQDSPFVKANSLVANLELLLPTVLHALQGKQLQPLLVSMHEVK